MTYSKIALSAFAAAAITLTGCGGGGTTSDPDPDPTPTPTPTASTLTGVISSDTTLTADKDWMLDGKVEVANGVKLTVEAGTNVVGKDGTDAWLMVMPGAQLVAEGTAAKPIVFTSEAELNDATAGAAGQWGGVTIIGNSANSQTGAYEVDDVTEAGTSGATSGSLKYVTINNTGIAVEANKEINGLSLFGVSSATTVENITVNRSGDDGVEIWGGSVNLTNITIDGAQDDSFDTDSGWTGMVDGLTITNGKKAGIEMSGTTVATYKNVSITVDSADSEGGLYFKAGSGEAVGGVFENVNVTYNSTAKGAIAVHGNFDNVNSKMDNVTLAGSNRAIVAKASDGGDDADTAEAQTLFDNGANFVIEGTEPLTGTISADKTLAANTLYLLDGKVVVDGATLTVEAGTKVVGKDGTDAWLMVMPSAQLIAEGTAAKPILFTSEAAHNGQAESAGQWGGVTLIGNSANSQTGAYEVDDTTTAGTSDATSGSLKYVTINNTGIAVEANKEINGLSLFGVSAATTVENITVNRSGDDGVEIWGGDVNLKDITIDGAQDDSFDTDSGWTGEVDGLTITNGKKAGIEMSGTTVATYKNVSITVDSADSEGGLYFKAGSGEVVGGKFTDVNVTYNSTAKGAIAVAGDFDNVNTTMTNVVLSGSNTAIVGKASDGSDDAEALEAKAIYDAQ